MKTFNKILIPLVLILFAFFFTGCPNPNTPVPEPDVTIPAAPTALVATVESDTAISLAWTDNADNETGFVVEWSKTNDFATIEDTATPAADATTLVATALDASTEYFFRVKAVNSAGDSAYAEASATTNDPPATIPAAPSALVIIVVSDTEMDVSWTDNSSDETGFELQWDTDNAFATYDDETPGANITTASVRGLTADTEYFFRIRAVNGVGSSDWSAIKNATTNPPPATGTFYINANATYATSTSVTLNSNITNVVEMRHANTSAGLASAPWVPYSDTRAWTLTADDGTKTVYGEYKNSVGTILAKSDSITLDTTAPTISSFVIWCGTVSTWAYSSTVQLKSTVTGSPAQMRFRNDPSTTWSPWVTYNSNYNWILTSYGGTTNENNYNYVYMEVRDAAGNVRSVHDNIKYDAIRRLKITAQHIIITDDSDNGSPGEIYWSFYGYDNVTSNVSFEIYNRSRSTAVTMNNGDSYNFTDVSVIHSMNNYPGDIWRVFFQIHEADPDPNPDDHSPLRYIKYHQSSNWGIGGTRTIYAGGSDDGPSGYMYFKVEYVD